MSCDFQGKSQQGKMCRPISRCFPLMTGGHGVQDDALFRSGIVPSGQSKHLFLTLMAVLLHLLVMHFYRI